MAQTYQCTEIQVEKPRVFPNGAHGDRCVVGQRGITAIEYQEGAMIITAVKDGKSLKFIVGDWLHGMLAEDQGGFACKVCGEVFKNAQGLGIHKKTCQEDAA